MYISTDAIILKNIPYKETSIISRIFSKETGKISIIFKGAKRPKNNISGSIEPGNLINITFFDKPNLKVSREIKLIKAYYNSRKYLMNFYYNMAIISLIDKLCMENQCYPNLYNNIIEIFDYIDQQKMNSEILFIYFLIQLNKNIGYEINFENFFSAPRNDKIRPKDIELINIFHQDIANIQQLDNEMSGKIDLINSLKIAIYKHMKNNVIDLNDIYAINMLKSMNDERTSRTDQAI